MIINSKPYTKNNICKMFQFHYWFKNEEKILHSRRRKEPNHIGESVKHKIRLPFNDFSKGELEECDHRIQNPVCEPLLIINRGLGLNCPNWGISVKETSPPKQKFQAIFSQKTKTQTIKPHIIEHTWLNVIKTENQN